MADINKIFPTKYLNPLDLDGKAHVVTIAKEEMVKFRGNEEETLILFFEGWEKGLCLQPSSARALAMIHGRHTENWVGKQIELYTTPIPANGGSRPVIQVRSPKTDAGTESTAQANGIAAGAPAASDSAA